MAMTPGRSLDGGPDLISRIEQTENERAYRRAEQWLDAVAAGRLTKDDVKARLERLSPESKERTRRALNEVNKRRKGRYG